MQSDDWVAIGSATVNGVELPPGRGIAIKCILHEVPLQASIESIRLGWPRYEAWETYLNSAGEYVPCRELEPGSVVHVEGEDFRLDFCDGEGTYTQVVNA